MDERQKKIIEALGLNEEQFEANEVSDTDRIEAIEEAVMELAEIVLGGEVDG